jgi:hypothetical protein
MDDPVDVAKVGFDAMLRGDGDVVNGWQNKLRSTIASITSSGMPAEMHRDMAEPGSEKKAHTERAQVDCLRRRMIAGFHNSGGREMAGKA